MFVMLDTSSRISVRPNLAAWKQAAATDVTYIAVTMMQDGTILAVGARDGRLYTLATPDSAPTLVPDSGAVRSVTVMPDDTIVGVGLTGNGLWTRATLLTSQWVGAPSDVPVVGVSVHPEGGLLGLSTEGVLLSKWRPSDPAWQNLPFPNRDLVAIAARGDGSILGVGKDGLLYVRPNMVDDWRQVPGSAAVTDVAEMPDGSLVALGGGLIYTAAGPPSLWTPTEGDGGVIAAATAPDGSIVGLDTGGQVVTRSSVGGAWTKAPAGAPMIDVSVFPDGVLLGVNKDTSLYTRAADLTTDWVRVPDSGAVTAATVLADGETILGVGMDVGLWTRSRTGPGGWVKVQGGDQGRHATSVNGLRDGSILGIEQGTDLVLRRIDLQSPWETCAPGGPGGSVIEVPEPGTTVPDAHRWLLQFTSSDPADPAGDGRPWGDGTAMAARAYGQRLPWDYGNRITPLVGGFATLGAIRDVFETAIVEADAMADRYPPGERGHVLIADWLLNGLRDLSEENAWGGGPWNPADTARKDQTALGLILRMMSAGITVRLLLWEPTSNQATNLKAHSEEHWSMAAAIQDHNKTLQSDWGLKEPVGVCALDLRTANPLTATLHQKMVAVRVGNLNVAFCGGVDLAFTRRDFGRPADELIGRGDWQSGTGSPVEKKGWPKQSPAPYGGYPGFPYTGGDKPFPEDLPADVYGKGPRHWHDQHLKLEGPIVTSLEQQFAERWIMNSDVYLFDRDSISIGGQDQVQLTSAAAINGDKVVPLPAARPCAPVGEAAVQVWRTIPLRPKQDVPPFARGEFTVMAGVAQAVARAKNLITIWDQYFWSEPLARLLTDRLRKESDLRLLIVLPPYGSSSSANEMWYRRRAVQFLWNNLDKAQQSRVLPLNTWAARPDIGVYVHAKVQTYDDSLLVCGSANMNRRSLSCDAELDCAVMHRPTLRTHLANLHLALTGKGWTDFGPGWTLRWWQSIEANHAETLVRDPFWQDDGGRRYTPNNVEITWDGKIPEWEFEPSSIGPVSWAGIPDIETNVCAGHPARLAGRLDEVTYLLERCHDKNTWPWRKPNTST
jgi:phosphatidylserine/phosphatidylglycerophosphate/cardiolipin synthase-like enzyme